jgi:hypothetical protein
MPRFPWQFTHCPVRCRIAVQSDADGSPPVRAKGLAEECLGRRYIPLRTETEIHGIAVPVHGTVQINPSSAHLQIRLVYTPGSADFACTASPALFELRQIPLDPTHDGRMRKFQFAFCHHLDKIAQAELIAKVPSDTQEDHLSVEMTPRKQSLHTLQFAHPHHDSTPVITLPELCSLFAPEPDDRGCGRNLRAPSSVLSSVRSEVVIAEDGSIPFHWLAA